MRYACNAEGEPGQRRSHRGCKEIGTGDRLPKPFGSHIITPCTLDTRNEARRFDFFSMLGFYHSRVKFFPFFFLSLFYMFCDKISWQKQRQGGKVYSGSQFKDAVHHGGEVQAAGD